MPTTTFANLLPAKRAAFLDAALDEFSARDFETASISRIVANLGIAKGSVYQYFADKSELYVHLVEHAEGVLLAALTEDGQPPEGADFFATLRFLMSRTVVAARRNPRESRLLERAYRNPALSSEETTRRSASTRRACLGALVEAAQRQGEVDPRVDSSLVTLVLDSVISQVGQWLDEQLGPDADDRYDDDRVEAVFDQAVSMLRHGLGGGGA